MQQAITKANVDQITDASLHHQGKRPGVEVTKAPFVKILSGDNLKKYLRCCNILKIRLNILMYRPSNVNHYSLNNAVTFHYLNYYNITKCT